MALAVVVLAAAGTGGYFLFGRPHHQPGPHPPSAVSPAGSPSGGGGSQPGTATPAGAASPAPSSPAPGDSEQAQLTQLAAVLHRSVAARAAVVRATKEVGACSLPPATGIGIMNRAISRRRSALNQLSADPVDAIPAGQVMTADLQRVLRRSIAADQDYIGWMQHIQAGGCPGDPSQDPSWQAASTASGQAITAKNRFLFQWNPPAARFGLPTYTKDQL